MKYIQIKNDLYKQGKSQQQWEYDRFPQAERMQIPNGKVEVSKEENTRNLYTHRKCSVEMYLLLRN